jgi:hypothetical protein
MVKVRDIYSPHAVAHSWLGGLKLPTAQIENVSLLIHVYVSCLVHPLIKTNWSEASSNLSWPHRQAWWRIVL